MIIPRINTPQMTHTWRSIRSDACGSVCAMTGLEDIRSLNFRYRSFFLQGAAVCFGSQKRLTA